MIRLWWGKWSAKNHVYRVGTRSWLGYPSRWWSSGAQCCGFWGALLNPFPPFPLLFFPLPIECFLAFWVVESMHRGWAHINAAWFDGIAFSAFKADFSLSLCSSTNLVDDSFQYGWRRTYNHRTILFSITNTPIVISMPVLLYIALYDPVHFLVPPSTTQIFFILFD